MACILTAVLAVCRSRASVLSAVVVYGQYFPCTYQYLGDTFLAVSSGLLLAWFVFLLCVFPVGFSLLAM